MAPADGHGFGVLRLSRPGGGQLVDALATRGGVTPTMSVLYSTSPPNEAWNGQDVTIIVTVELTGTHNDLFVEFGFDDSGEVTAEPADEDMNGWTNSTGWVESGGSGSEKFATFTHAGPLTTGTYGFTLTVSHGGRGEADINLASAGSDEVPIATEDPSSNGSWYYGFWGIDATSLIAVPSDNDQWSDIIAAWSLAIPQNPTNLWAMQEASGNLSDSIGSVTLTASGTRSYQNAITGWDRDGLGTTDGTGGAWQVASGTGPNPATTSVACLAYIRIDSATAERGILKFSDSTNNLVALSVNAAGTLRWYIDTGTGSGSTNYEGGSVFPVLFVYDRTNSRAKVYTTSEVITATYSSGVADGNKGFGHTTVPATVRYLYACWFTGSGAEWLSTDNSARAFLQMLGWSPVW